MSKLCICLALLLSLGLTHIGGMTLEDRPDDFGDESNDEMLLSAPSNVAEEMLSRGGWDAGDTPVVSVSKRVPRPPLAFLNDAEAPQIDTDSLLRAAMAMREEKEAEELEAEQRAEVAQRRRAQSRVRAVTPAELEELLGEAPRRKKSTAAVVAPEDARSPSLLRRYLQSALGERGGGVARKRKRSLSKESDPQEEDLEDDGVEKRSLQRRKRVVKRGAPPPQAEDEVQEEGEEASPREALLRDLLVSNALLNAENGFLTDALNAATVAQTNGNAKKTLREEMIGIENAEKIEAVMEQLQKDQEMVEKNGKNQPKAIDETVVVTDNSIANLDACPAVREFSTGCKAVINAYKFAMDQDAIDACDAHHVCYGCSSSSQSSRRLCDQIFMVQSKNLCEKEENRGQCVSEAADLLLAMQDRHEMDFVSSPEREKFCRNPCVDAFFSAVYRPRR